MWTDLLSSPQQWCHTLSKNNCLSFQCPILASTIVVPIDGGNPKMFQFFNRYTHSNTMGVWYNHSTTISHDTWFPTVIPLRTIVCQLARIPFCLMGTYGVPLECIYNINSNHKCNCVPRERIGRWLHTADGNVWKHVPVKNCHFNESQRNWCTTIVCPTRSHKIPRRLPLPSLWI